MALGHQLKLVARLRRVDGLCFESDVNPVLTEIEAVLKGVSGFTPEIQSDLDPRLFVMAVAPRHAGKLLHDFGT